MFLRRRNLIILGIVLIVLATIVVAASMVKKDPPDPYKVVCDNLIDAISRYDYDAGYALLSAENKEFDDVISWREKTSVLGNVYKSAQVVLDNREEITLGVTQTPSKVLFTYTITHPAMTSEVQCTSALEDSKHVISDFRSYKIDPETQADTSTEGTSQ